MSEQVRQINQYFREALKTEIDDMAEQLALSDFQYDVFYRYYVRKQNLDFIADEVGKSSDSIAKTLKHIRKKILKFLHY